MATTARITWVEDRTFLAQSGSGHTLTVGTTKGPDGRNLSPSPMEMVLMGTGGCTAFDVVMILERSREPIEGCVAELEAERAEEDPQVFKRLHIHFVVTGAGLKPDNVELYITLSAEKYCSATAMIAKTADITHDFEVIDSRGA